MTQTLRVALSAATALVLGCQTSKSAEKQDSFGQQAATRREAGPVRVVRTVEEFATTAEEGNKPMTAAPSNTGTVAPGAPATGQLTRRTVTVTERAPVVSTTQTSTEASGEAHSASAARFGWSPWSIAVGLAVAAALAYGAFWVKRKLAL